MATQRYLYGNLTLRKRKKGPDVWQYRWYENGRPKSMLIGTVEKLPTRADAERKVEALRVQINARNSQSQFHSVTVGGLIDRYLSEELSSVRRSTGRSYEVILENWIRPKWGNIFLESVRTMDVERWLKTIPRSPGTKAHIRNMYHLLFNCAIRWEMFDRNPVNHVRQSSKRMRVPKIITPEEFRRLLAELKEPYRTIVIVTACLGLRISEVLGLRWSDIDWTNLVVMVQRSVVGGMIYQTKSEASNKPMPIDPRLAESLLEWRRQAVYVEENDFIFAGDSGKPRWQGIMLTKIIKPAALRAGIGNIGWHTLRRTFASLLGDEGTPLAVQKELLRHADVATTMNIYTQAIDESKRQAVHKVAGKLFGG